MGMTCVIGLEYSVANPLRYNHVHRFVADDENFNLFNYKIGYKNMKFGRCYENNRT